jgi:hypothetical protein
MTKGVAHGRALAWCGTLVWSRPRGSGHRRGRPRGGAPGNTTASAALGRRSRRPARRAPRPAPRAGPARRRLDEQAQHGGGDLRRSAVAQHSSGTSVRPASRFTSETCETLANRRKRSPDSQSDAVDDHEGPQHQPRLQRPVPEQTMGRVAGAHRLRGAAVHQPGRQAAPREGALQRACRRSRHGHHELQARPVARDAPGRADHRRQHAADHRARGCPAAAPASAQLVEASRPRNSRAVAGAGTCSSTGAAHVAGLHAPLAVEGLLERQDAQQGVHVPGDLPDPPRPPGPTMG